MIFLKTPIMTQPQQRYAILLSNILFRAYYLRPYINHTTLFCDVCERILLDLQ